jgi:hypothetical protein
MRNDSTDAPIFAIVSGFTELDACPAATFPRWFAAERRSASASTSPAAKWALRMRGSWSPLPRSSA